MLESKDSLLKIIIIIKLNLDITETKINKESLMNIDQRIYSNDSDVNESVKAI